MIDSSAFDKYMTPQQKDTFRVFKEKTSNIKARITIYNESIEIQLVAGSAEAAQYLPQIATSIGTMLSLMFSIRGEIIKRS